MRARTRLLVALAPAWLALAAGCASLVGIADFTSGPDGGTPDGTAGDASGPDAMDAMSVGTESGTDAEEEAMESEGGPGDGGVADAPGADSPPTVPPCVIGTISIPNGQASPTNACLMCQVDASTTTLTAGPNGAACGDSGSCSSGGCVIAPSNPPSCLGDGGAGLRNCGANADDDCCATLEVQGGTYDRSYSDLGNGQVSGSPATVSSFGLDKYDVTVGRFRAFANAVNAGYLPGEGSGKHAYLNQGAGLVNAATGGGNEPGWSSSDDANLVLSMLTTCAPSTWTPSPVSGSASQENLPINCVDWAEAYAFCIWDGGFLPSEAEWEYAAAGGSLQLDYPWGSAGPGTLNAYAIYGCYYPSASAPPCLSVENIAPVGTASRGAGFWGQLDMAGEMNQWTLDWFGGNYPSSTCQDCAYLPSSPPATRIIRGGDFNTSTANLSTTIVPPARNSVDPTARNASVGFRCGRAP